ncbi:HEAT repeat domain-containing protein [Myxacorys almedinensis]|uniref:HEAT repeat domain-containing protein n=1 Tax=Myxacorys almedinensis A TaxID=2690445 RepID=A0A8J7Z160_9CYAN|nr:HEAT repeat domain-containing protein [Myxacorys almedinensis]NDJ18187.1 HEAT repeat domain-containing protein [Myxacorys almedinensis A]
MDSPSKQPDLANVQFLATEQAIPPEAHEAIPPEAHEAIPPEAHEAIANLRHEDLSIRYYAAWWLGKFRVRDVVAVDALIAALDDDANRTAMGGYPLRRNAARALGKLGDKRAVAALIRCLDCSDFYVREAAAQALEALGDASCISALLSLLDGGVDAAQFAPGLPHLVQPYEAVIEALGTLHATEAVEQIRPFADHGVERVRYAAMRSLYQLTHDPYYAEHLVGALSSSEVQLRRSALADLGAIGYVPAASAIAQAPVENSFKLLALKGLLGHHLSENDAHSEAAIRLMTLMDTLL